VKEITNPGKKGYKEKTKQNEVHRITISRWRWEKCSSLGISGEYAHFAVDSSRAE
jgi:hypothetical protein